MANNKKQQQEKVPVHSKSSRKTFSNYIDYVMNVGDPDYPDYYEIGDNQPPIPQISEKKKSLEKNVEYSNPQSAPALSLEFDGDMLTFRVDEGDRIKRYSYSAVAGKPLMDGSFDYSKERQKIAGEGPLPEGEYWINPNEIRYAPEPGSPKDILYMIGGMMPPKKRFSPFPGGSVAWGRGRVPIYPQEVVVDNVKRGGFTIHGGTEPGSAGCIDLTNQEEKFFKEIEKYKKITDSIPLRVNYSSQQKKYK